jgi:hypothetical protein
MFWTSLSPFQKKDEESAENHKGSCTGFSKGCMTVLTCHTCTCSYDDVGKSTFPREQICMLMPLSGGDTTSGVVPCKMERPCTASLVAHSKAATRAALMRINAYMLLYRFSSDAVA